MRLIDADKIIAWIDDWNKGLSKSDDTIRDVLDTVVDELYDAESWEWLTEPEDIPIEGTECLVTIEDEDGETWITIAEYTGESFVIFTDDGETADVTDEVKAWMMLPEPYEE